MKQKNTGEILTESEKQVLQLLCKDFTCKQIAEKMYLSPRTVEDYKYRLIKKLSVNGMAGLIIYAEV